MNWAKLVGQVVRIEWDDAIGHSEWMPRRDALELPLAHASDVGEVLNVEDGKVRIASSRDDQGNVAGVSVIPTGWVTRVSRLR